MNMGSLRLELMMPHPHTFLAEDEDEDELETGRHWADGAHTSSTGHDIQPAG